MSVIDMVMEQLNGPTLQRMAGQLGATPQQTQTAIAAALPVLLGAMQRNASSEAGAQSLHRAVTRDHLNVDLGGVLGSILGGGGNTGDGDLGGLLGGILGGGQQQPQQRQPQRESGGGLMDVLGDMMGAGQQQQRQPQRESGGLMDVLGDMMGGGQQQQRQPQPESGGGLMGVLGGIMGGGGDSSQSPAGGGMGEAILRHVLGGSQNRAAGGISKASGLDLGAVMKLLPMLTPLIMAAIGRMTQQRNLDAGGISQVLGGEMQRVGGGDPGSRGFLGGLLDADGDGDVDASDLLARGGQLLGGFQR